VDPEEADSRMGVSRRGEGRTGKDCLIGTKLDSRNTF
jgi:hypothetical protein